MKIVKINLTQLLPHPANANVMSDDFIKKLKNQIEPQGLYEPLVVRPHPTQADSYQLINGHHRKVVLESLGHLQANCVVWPLSDEQALMVLATINRLSGHDDPKKRAALLDKLTQRFDEKILLQNLPEKRQHLQKLLTLNQPPKLIPPNQTPNRLEALTFFVTPQQKHIINQTLKQIKKNLNGDDPTGKTSRGDILACLAHQWLQQHQ